MSRHSGQSIALPNLPIPIDFVDKKQFTKLKTRYKGYAEVFHIVFIQRTFNEIERWNPITRNKMSHIWPKLEAFIRTDKKNYISKRDIVNDSRTFFTTAHMNKLQPKNPPKDVFKSFRVAVPRIVVLSRNEALSPEGIKHFFIQKVRQQIGTRVFFNLNGYLTGLKTFIDLNNNQYKGEEPFPICSIYPVIQYEWDKEPKDLIDKRPEDIQRFVYGLSYESGGRDDRKGKRYYHRLHDRKLELGHVFEIDSKYINGLKDTVAKSKGHWFGLYVCAGARLVIHDNLIHRTVDKKPSEERHHNTSLVQQGGVVFVNAELRLSVPHVKREADRDEIDWHPYDYRSYVLKEFVQYFVAPKSDEPEPEKDFQTRINELENFKFPILFLGANDSQYNTISWALSIDVKNGPNDKEMAERLGFLEIPEGGRIAAIADGMEPKDGIEEIKWRLHYEGLHHSVVLPINLDEPNLSSDTFVVPDPQTLINRLLDPKERNVFEFSPGLHRYKRRNPRQILRPLFRERNIQRFTSIEKPEKLTYFAPPMAPPLYDNKDDDYRYYSQIQFMYPKYMDTDPWTPDPYKEWYKFDDKWYSLENDVSIREYQWTKTKEFAQMDYRDHQTRLHFKAVPYEVNNRRIGVDGWIWEKTGKEPIATMKTHRYIEKSPSQESSSQGSSGLNWAQVVAKKKT